MRECSWCGRPDCPRWVAVSRLVAFGLRRAFGTPRPTDTDAEFLRLLEDLGRVDQSETVCKGASGEASS